MVNNKIRLHFHIFWTVVYIWTQKSKHRENSSIFIVRETKFMLFLQRGLPQDIQEIIGITEAIRSKTSKEIGLLSCT